MYLFKHMHMNISHPVRTKEAMKSRGNKEAVIHDRLEEVKRKKSCDHN